jgi:hypothetical protein
LGCSNPVGRYAFRLPRTPPPVALCGCDDGLVDLCDADDDDDDDEASEDGFLPPAVDAKLDSMLENWFDLSWTCAGQRVQVAEARRKEKGKKDEKNTLSPTVLSTQEQP